jgi:hypothetical protein
MHPGSQHRLQLRGHVPSSGGLCAVRWRRRQGGRVGVTASGQVCSL